MTIFYSLPITHFVPFQWKTMKLTLNWYPNLHAAIRQAIFFSALLQLFGWKLAQFLKSVALQQIFRSQAGNHFLMKSGLNQANKS